jgi:hypothetical protein
MIVVDETSILFAPIQWVKGYVIPDECVGSGTRPRRKGRREKRKEEGVGDFIP